MSRSIWPIVCWLAWAAAWMPAAGQVNDPNRCDHPAEAPDVIVGEIDEVIYWGAVGGTGAFSFSTWSCNIGTCELAWQAGTHEHPVIAQNMFRLRNGRFEQIGQSWLKHGFFALSLDLCDQGCVQTDGTTLGVNCSDPYTADLNGLQQTLGPKWEVNPSTGRFPYPFTDSEGSATPIFKRLQVAVADIATAANPDARYFVEAQYVTLDDAFAGNQDNNASYRAIAIDDTQGVETSFVGATFRGRPAIFAWAAADPEVTLKSVSTGEGRFYVASRATPLADGRWHYEYAAHNLNSHRGARAFRVPVPVGATLTDIGFHDVDYHSGEPFDGTDWAAALENGGTELVWRTSGFAENALANALRWGTLYNFRFVADVAPDDREHPVALELFRLGQPGEVQVELTVPNPCAADGTCTGAEDCLNCAVDCLAPGETCCGDLTCDGNEDGCTCAVDCGDCFAGGAIPDGSLAPARPLTVSRSPGDASLRLDWEASCQADDTDYAVYRGLIGNFASHQRLVCTTEGVTTATFAAPFFNAYFLVAPTNGLTEGSLGTDSAGRLRPPGPPLQSCLPRRISGCPDE